MNIFDRYVMATNPVKGLERMKARAMAQGLQKIQKASAGYDAAGSGRRWFKGQSTSQNTENKKSLRAMRQVSRELERNYPSVGTACQVNESYIVGNGIIPKAKGLGNTSAKKVQLANDLMANWVGDTEIDYYGNSNFFAQQGLFARTVCASGESLFVRRDARDRRLDVPLRLQLVEGDFIDDSKDSNAAGTRNMVQGIEFINGRKANYYLYNEHPGDVGFISNSSVPVAADEIAHGFELLRPGQVRGLPWGYSVFNIIKGLSDFDDAFIELQRMAACFGAFVYEEEPDQNAPKNSILPDDMEPQTIVRLQGSERVVFSSPPTVSGQTSFTQRQDRIIASGYGIAYSALTGDFSTGNFAAEKMARIQMYMNIARRRNRILRPQLKKIEKWWLEAAALAGYDLRGVYFDWTPPKKEILDIKNELPVIIQKIRAGLGSLQGELREMGIDDPSQVLYELKDDKDLIESLHLTLDSMASQTNKNGQIQTAPAPETDNQQSENADEEE